MRARLGPRPGTARVISISPGGNFARSFSADGVSPVSSRVMIFSCSVLPIPGSCVARPARASAATDGHRGLIVDDASPDGTGAIADRLAAELPGEVDVLHRHAKLGLGQAYL